MRQFLVMAQHSKECAISPPSRRPETLANRQPDVHLETGLQKLQTAWGHKAWIGN
jgi:hypothetical protein